MMIRTKLVIENWKQAKGEDFVFYFKRFMHSKSLLFVNFVLFFFFTVFSL